VTVGLAGSGPAGAGSPGVTLLVLAKEPRPGHSKTRLIPTFGPDGAARLAAAALADTLDAVRRAEVSQRMLVLDGSSESLSCKGFGTTRQVTGSHVERIIAAFEMVDDAALLIGMDTPQVEPHHIAIDLGAAADAWLGQAEDGGWWALGLRHARRDARRVLDGVPMSTQDPGALPRDRLVRNGLRVVDLPVLRDVDVADDAHAVAGTAPRTRFAACLRALAEPAGSLR
jgi:glycosyltransferase A (GT-A) superfamily protein (DUF2064 family)